MPGTEDKMTTADQPTSPPATPAETLTPTPDASQPKVEPRTLLLQLQEVSETFRDCKPVALRIDKAIALRFPDVERKVIRAAMRMHTASTRYLKVMEKGGQRFDLDGKPDGEVTAEHQAHAAQTLKERFAEVARRKRDKARQEETARREEEAEKRKAEKLQQLVGKFGRG